MGITTPFVLIGLTIEQSWSLQKSIAFADDSHVLNNSLESFGEKIARRCKVQNYKIMFDCIDLNVTNYNVYIQSYIRENRYNKQEEIKQDNRK